MTDLYIIEFQNGFGEWRIGHELDGGPCLYIDLEAAEGAAEELKPQVGSGALRIAVYHRGNERHVEWDNE